MRDKNISPTELAQRLNRPRSTVYHWINSRNLKSEVVTEICDALNTKRYAFYGYGEDITQLFPSWISPEKSEIMREINQLDSDEQVLIWSTLKQILELIQKKRRQ